MGFTMKPPLNHDFPMGFPMGFPMKPSFSSKFPSVSTRAPPFHFARGSWGRVQVIVGAGFAAGLTEAVPGRQLSETGEDCPLERWDMGDISLGYIYIYI